MAANTTAIAELDAALASGVQSVTTDGLTVTYKSRAEMLAELRRLQADDDATTARRRPVAATINLSGF